ncbi:MAG: TonB-dependent receptor plug domain-containing protein [Rhizomicrobium sp.]
MLNLKNSLLVGASVSAFAVFAAPAFAQDNGGSNETVIVTGTRVQGMTAADSAAPITVLGTDALTKGTGSTDLRQALGQTIPSFVAQQFGGDTANLTLSAALRGLSPNDTLVLINGHRRHYTGNLHVDAGGFAAGSSSADLSFIPEGAIDHVEVLLDGAAAQYGTDAIAGVVNIILKKKSSGGDFSATAGDYYNRGGRAFGKNGESYTLSYNMGMPLFDKGFVNFTVEKSFNNFTQYGGADPRYINAQGVPVAQQTVTGLNAFTGLASLSPGNNIPNSVLPFVKGYPRSNPINGNPEVQTTMGELNSAYDFSDSMQLYAFGTYGHKFAKSFENERLPNQIIATLGSNQPCSATNPNGYNTVVNASGAAACAPGVNGGTANPIPGEVGLTGLNSKGIVISSGQAGNLFSNTLINATTGAAVPSPTGAGTLSNVPELVYAPGGFRPMEVLKEDDYQYDVGLKFNLLGWDMNADVSYGKDIDSIYTWNSGNRSLFIDTHTTPSNFYDGSFSASQFQGTIDATHGFNVGMASPLTVALGVEAREDTYGITSGDPASYYKEGAQSFPGFPPSGAGIHSRKNYAGYIDLALAPIEALQLDVAGRAEHYTDFGDAQIGKITARYDFNPMIAVRGTLSTGFRAPTLAEEFYTAVNVSPVAATVQLPANSAAAALLGLGNLRPETSVSYSAGIVAHPFEDMSVTVDAYSIAIGNRITTSATVNSAGGAINVPLVTQAVALDNVSLDPTATQQGVTSFLNGLSTLTQGVDVTLNYPTDFGTYGLVDWTLAGNYNDTSVSRVAPTPVQITNSAPGASFFRPDTLKNYVHSAPQEKIGLTANWSLDEFGITFRETYWGPQHSTSTPNNGGELVTFNQAGVGLTDMELRYNVTEQLQFAFGGNNVFNIRPDLQPFAGPPVGNALGNNPSTGVAIPAGNGSVSNTPFGTAWNPNGGYYYGRINFNF